MSTSLWKIGELMMTSLSVKKTFSSIALSIILSSCSQYSDTPEIVIIDLKIITIPVWDA